ncbi:conserved hypothetical protein [Vibrio phage 277E43-1]|nr:conserved hypothetical protein [Vibrio phage 277E43-1]
MALYTAKKTEAKQLLEVVEFKAHRLPSDVLIKDVKQRFNIPRKRLKVLENKTNYLLIGNSTLRIEVTTDLQNTKFEL